MAVRLVFLLAMLALPHLAAAQPAPCEALAEEIGAKLEANGVPYFRLWIVAPDEVSGRTVVGTCEFGSRRIVYERLSGPDGGERIVRRPPGEPPAPPAPGQPPAAPEAAPPPAPPAPPGPVAPPAPPRPSGVLSVVIEVPGNASPVGSLPEVSGTTSGGLEPVVSIQVHDDQAQQVWNGRAWLHASPDAGLDPWLPASTERGRWRVTAGLPGEADLAGHGSLRITARVTGRSGSDAVATKTLMMVPRDGTGPSAEPSEPPAQPVVAEEPPPTPGPVDNGAAAAAANPDAEPLVIPASPDALVELEGLDADAGPIRIRRADVDDLRTVSIASGMFPESGSLESFVRATTIGQLPRLSDGTASGPIDYLLVETAQDVDSRSSSMVLRNREVLLAEDSSIVLGLLPERHEGLHDLCVAIRDLPTSTYLYSYWVFEYTGEKYIRRSRAWGRGTCDTRLSVPVRRR